jgi:single-strand DNA-binding protein
MASVNQVTLVGRVGKDPDIRYTQKGDAIVSFSLATSEKYKDKEETQWHRVDVFGKLATLLKDYIVKGKQLYVQGQLVYDNWEDKQGNKRTTAKVKVGFNGQIVLLGDRGEARGGAPANTFPEPEQRAGSASGSGVEIPADDEIPF